MQIENNNNWYLNEIYSDKKLIVSIDKSYFLFYLYIW